jgi:hypothetical protein
VIIEPQGTQGKQGHTVFEAIRLYYFHRLVDDI